jgi:hypothetical protein
MAARRSTRWWADRGLSLACLALFGAAQVAAAVAGWLEFLDEQRSHEQAATVFGPDGYIWTLLEQTLQNWQSEFLALATLIVLSASLVHRGSKHSRDGNDEVRRRVQAIQRRVEALTAPPAAAERG